MVSAVNVTKQPSSTQNNMGKPPLTKLNTEKIQQTPKQTTNRKLESPDRFSNKRISYETAQSQVKDVVPRDNSLVCEPATINETNESPSDEVNTTNASIEESTGAEAKPKRKPFDGLMADYLAMELLERSLVNKYEQEVPPSKTSGKTRILHNILQITQH